ncbi:response regulator receiver [Rhodomicrobium vannielii ATCC 17100]|uniref:Response regulator receiver n=1 Tax=Rhodomicrobium vannielii (strain ATCC 17100 / DSM 162 / LMG 4299 / NCIMB 10020 / ATH 3.1.1) TaxID=648757 RepID=E3I5T1_RHOVT|nr:response regulator [Rhodomicrobium vannielii]ADP69434.1 response regulator receiver [Rhodomicrobium vannielii ATCC 17100]
MVEQRALAGARVLIVEDDALSAHVAQEMLAELGCSVTGVAASVDQALHEINNEKQLDCVMLDVRLGRELSSDIATYLLQQNLPFIICSGYDIKLPGMNIPVVDKPYTVAALAQALSLAMTQKAL